MTEERDYLLVSIEIMRRTAATMPQTGTTRSTVALAERVLTRAATYPVSDRMLRVYRDQVRLRLTRATRRRWLGGQGFSKGERWPGNTARKFG